MKFLMDNWMLIAIAVSSGIMLFLPVMQGAGGGLTPDAAVMLINREKAVVVDVCEANEFAAGHIGGARNIPLGQLEGQLAAQVKNKALPLILVCQSGVRSGRAVAVAKKLGYDNVHNLAGGLKEWAKVNLPVEKSA